MKVDAFFIPCVMKKLELFTGEDLRNFNSKIGYFIEGNGGLLDDNDLPKYSRSYDRIENQVKLTELISNCELKKELTEHIEHKITANNEEIVKKLRHIKLLQEQIVELSDISDDIKPMKSSKVIFNHIANK